MAVCGIGAAAGDAGDLDGASVLLLTLVALLVLQPDFGQTMLILMVWGALFFIAGMRMIWVVGLARRRGGRIVRRLSAGAARRAAASSAS